MLNDNKTIINFEELLADVQRERRLKAAVHIFLAGFLSGFGLAILVRSHRAGHTG
jgi:hypothetical protein